MEIRSWASIRAYLTGGWSKRTTKQGLPLSLQNVIAAVAAIHARSLEYPEGFQAGEVLHLLATNSAFDRWHFWLDFFGHGATYAVKPSPDSNRNDTG